jgi:hypothetical protein
LHNGKLALHGILGTTVTAWHEQIILLLEDAASDRAASARRAGLAVRSWRRG